VVNSLTILTKFCLLLKNSPQPYDFGLAWFVSIISNWPSLLCVIPNPLTHWKSIYDNVFMKMNTHELKGNFNIAKEQSHVFPFYHISNIQMAY
jgi:hypothetical protein